MASELRISGNYHEPSVQESSAIRPGAPGAVKDQSRISEPGLHLWRTGRFRGTHSPGRPHGRPGEPGAFGWPFFCRRCDTKRDTDPAAPGESSALPDPALNATARFLSQVRHETGHGPRGAWGIECSAWPGAQRNGAFFVAGATRNATRTRRRLGNRVLLPGPALNATARFLSQVRHETVVWGRGRPVRASRDFIYGAQMHSVSLPLHLRSCSFGRKVQRGEVRKPGSRLPRQMTPLRVNKMPPNSRQTGVPPA